MSQKRPQRDEKGRFLKGNQGASKHSGYRYLKTGKLPKIKGIRKLREELDRIKAELEAATPGLNIKKSLLINQICKAAGFCMIFESYLKQSGILEPHAMKKKILSFQPGFTTYLSLLNLQRSALQHLSLDESQVEKILTPFQIVESEERQRRAKVRRGKKEKAKEQEANKQ